MERIKKFFAPPVFEDPEQTRQAYMLNMISWIFTSLATLVILSLISAFSDGISGETLFNLSYRVIPFYLASILGQILMRNGRVRAASIAYVAILWLAYTISVFTSGSVYASEFAFYFLAILISGLLLGARASVILLVASIVASGISVFLYNQGIVPQIVLERTTFITQWLTVSLGFTIGTLVLYLFTREINRAQEELQTANQELEEAQQALEIQVNVKTRGLELAAAVGHDLAQERNLDVLLEKAVDAIRAQFDLYYVQIYLADEGQNRLILRAGTGDVGDALVARGHRLAFGAGSINGAAATTQQPIVVSDTAANPLFRPNALLPDTKSEMSVPLLAADKVVGVLNVQSNEVYGLTPEDFTTYTVLAGQLAIAIENANLFAETRAAQRAANEEAKRSTYENWEAYLNAIARHERFGYTFDGLSLEPVRIEGDQPVKVKDETMVIPIVINGEMVGSIEVEAEELEDTSKVMVNAVAQQIAQHAESLRLLSDAERYRDEAQEAIRRLTRESWEGYQPNLDELGYEYDQNVVRPIPDVAENEDAHVTLTHGIEVHGESIGLLEICDVDPNSVEAEALVSSVTAVLSAHIENLRLSEQTEVALADSEKRGADLNLINRVVSLATESLDMELTLQAITEELGNALGYDRISISLIDLVRNNFQIMAEYLADPAARRTKGMTFSLDGDRLIPEVIRTRSPLIITNIHNSPSNSPAFEMVRTMGIEMFAMLPMMVGQDVVGTLSLASQDSERVPTEAELSLLQTMIRQIATAVQNARLFAETQQRARRDQILNEITARVYAAVDADSVLQTAAKEINRQLGLETYVILDEETGLEPQAENGSNGHQS